MVVVLFVAVGVVFVFCCSGDDKWSQCSVFHIRGKVVYYKRVKMCCNMEVCCSGFR